MRPIFKYLAVLCVVAHTLWAIVRSVGVETKVDHPAGSAKFHSDRVDFFADPQVLSADDFAPPGKEPDGSEASGVELGWIYEKWEAQRLRHTRATYLQSKKNVSRPFRCLPDKLQGGDGPAAWKSRTASSDPARVLPMTEAVQRAIYDHQHPADCSKAKFLVWRMWNTGLGADIHTLGQALGFAMATNRVLLVDTSAVWWYAMDRHPASLECFFIPPSNCQLSDAGNVTVLMSRWSRRKGKMQPMIRMAVLPEGPRSVANPLRRAGDVANKWSMIPRREWTQFGYQWWMAQTVRYLLRKPQPWFDEKLRQWVAETFPEGIPKKMIGMHVRHGDKYKEMKLLDFSLYMTEARVMRQAEPDLRDIFISTEDPGVLEETKAYLSEGWRFHWTKNYRSNEGSPMDYAMLVGPSMLGEISFVNLLIQELHCTHWIGTDKSNWNRLINELRLTTGSYGKPYIQLNKQKCVLEPNPFGNVSVPGWVKGC